MAFRLFLDASLCFDFRHQTGLRDVKESAAIFEEMDHYQALGRCMLLSGNIKHALGAPSSQTVDFSMICFF